MKSSSQVLPLLSLTVYRRTVSPPTWPLLSSAVTLGGCVSPACAAEAAPAPNAMEQPATTKSAPHRLICSERRTRVPHRHPRSRGFALRAYYYAATGAPYLRFKYARYGFASIVEP